MSEKAEKILQTFARIIPDLTEVEKEKLLSYGEGYAAGIRARKEIAQKEVEEQIEKAS